jgi:hypothetical protein
MVYQNYEERGGVTVYRKILTHAVIMLPYLVCVGIIIVLSYTLYMYLTLQPKVGVTLERFYDNSFAKELPIDVVYTWVDGEDPEWKKLKSKYPADSRVYTDDSKDRYTCGDAPDKELSLSIESLYRMAPWVNHIYIIAMDGQIPQCIEKANTLFPGRVTMIYHSHIFQKEHLPVFNSHAIEANLHRIDGLSNQFIYFNDDVYLTKKLDPADCFHEGKPLIQPLSRGLVLTGSVFSRVWLNMAKRYYPINMVWHGFHCLTVDGMTRAAQSVPEHWNHTSASRIRKETDLSPVGYTVNYMLKRRLAYLSDRPLVLLEIQNSSSVYTHDPDNTPDVVCINYSENLEHSLEEVRKSLYVQKNAS